MIDDRLPLPESIGGLVSIAIRAYRRRFRLFFGAAFAGLLLEAVMGYVWPGDAGLFYAGSVVVDSFLAALVTLGIVADRRDAERLSDRAIAGAALDRWGVVSVVTALVDFVTVTTSDAVFGPPEATAYGFLILPIVVLWGSIAFASVIAATDEKMPTGVLILASLGRSISLALARPNVGRLIAVAIVAVLPTLVETVLYDQLALRHVAASQFIANIPIDVFVTGPLQAIFTVFYLDFVRRTTSPRPS